MASTQSTSSGGIGITGAIFLVFLALKLIGIIDWSWWWVTAPLWGSLMLLLMILAAGLTFTLVAHALKRSKR